MTTGLLHTVKSSCAQGTKALHNALPARSRQVKRLFAALVEFSGGVGGCRHTWRFVCSAVGRLGSRIPDLLLLFHLLFCVLVGFLVVNPLIRRNQTNYGVCGPAPLTSRLLWGTGSQLIYLIDQAWSGAVSSVLLLLWSCCSMLTSWSQHRSWLQYGCPPPLLLHTFPLFLLLISFLSPLFLYATTLLPFPERQSRRARERGRERQREAVTCITLVGTVCNLPCTVKSKEKATLLKMSNTRNECVKSSWNMAASHLPAGCLKH